MKHRFLRLLCIGATLAVSLGCYALSEEDRVATEVAVQKAASQTLTAAAPTVAGATTPSTPSPSRTAGPAPTLTSTPGPVAPEPTSTPTPILTPTVSVTPTLQPGAPPVTPELVFPELGRTYDDPITFEWRGSLSGDQRYQVVARHPGSGYEVKGGLLTGQTWTLDLPDDRFGEWRWQVFVIQNGTTLAASEEWMFWFQPNPELDTPNP
jgi:hypothetical protein